MPEESPVTGAFKRLHACKSFPEARARLLAGVPPTRVAMYVHECGEYLDYTLPSLVVTLCAYRRQLSAMELVATKDPKFVTKAKQQINDAFDELNELAVIYNIQKERIVQGRELEKKMMILNKTLGNEVRIAGEILRTRATIKEQIGFGSDGPEDVNPAFRLDTRSRYGERVARVIEDPKKRNRVLNAVTALIEAGAVKAKQAG